MSENQRSSHIGPVQARERIEFVDILRGFAILGILVANMAGYAGFATSPEAWTDPLDRAITILTRFLVEAKFYSLFSLLFGWGMAVQMARSKDRDARFAPLWLRRMLILLVFGLIHGILIWSGDILTLYALYGILLLPFGNRSEKTVLISATLALLLSIVVTLPGGAFDAFRAWYEHATAFLRSEVSSDGFYASGTYLEITGLRIHDCLWGHSWFVYTFGNVFGMFLLGLYTGRRRIFQEIDRHLPLVRRTMWAGLAIGVIFNGLYVLTILNRSRVPIEYYPMVSRGTRTIGAPALMLFYVSGIILLVQKDSWRHRLAPLASVGRMALTNYLLHSVVCTLIFYSYGLGLYGEVDPLLGLILTAVIYLAQIRLSEWWLRRYRFGPAEWLWRTLTYGRLHPLRRGAAYGDHHRLDVVGRLRSLASRVDAKRALVSVWILLLAWAAVLGIWYIYLEGSVTGAAPSLELIEAQTEATEPSAVTGESSVTEIHGERATEPQPDSEAALVVEPVAYVPGPIAASGDLMALASTFDAVSALQQIETLAAPPFYGRYPASPGGWAAGEYIAEQFARYGLQPAGDAGTYFQAFPFEYVALAAMPNLIVEVPGGTTHEDYTLHEDYSTIVRQYLGHGVASGEVVWAVNCAPNDFDSVDVVGKIVLCRTRSLSDAGRNALEHGAAGLLLLIDPAQRPADFGTTYYEPLVPQPIPALLVYPPVVEDLLAGSDLSWADLSTSFTASPLATRARIEVQTKGAEACPIQGCLGRNVLGVLPGRDLSNSDQVIIIGAHYDHLGQAPDGTVWTGANDDASGVAILLELARTWHEQGFVPRQTVLFAAWDAEEEGLLGSTHYVLHPRYSLRDTVAMIQFDMVGTGEDTLRIDGGGELGEHLYTVAEALGIETEVTHLGRSDHVPFLQAGVPADLLIWRYDEAAQPQYHRPVDTPAIIETDKLQAVGQIAALTILGLSEGDAAIGDLLAKRTEAIEQDDLEAFLDTSIPRQQALDRLWFADIQSLLQSLRPARFEMEALNIRILGQAATATVRMTLEEIADDEQAPQTLTAQFEARFEHDGHAWRWAGANLIWTDLDDGLAVAYPPGSEEGLDGLGQHAAQQYAEFAARLGLPAETEATLMLYPNTHSLRASTALSLPPSQGVWVSEGVVKLTYRRDISSSLQLTDALAQLLLVEADVTEASAPWLWQGLPLVLRADDPVAAQSEYLPRLQHLLAADVITPNKVTAWAAVSYVQQRLGWQGLGQFVTDLGQACRDDLCEDDDSLDRVLLSTLQLDAVSFESAWQGYWRGRLATAQVGLDALLAARAEAILARDETAFLNTVDPSVPGLLAEEQHWFVELSQSSLADFSLTGIPVALLPDGGFLADVTLDFHLADADAVPWGGGTIPLKAHLTPGGDGVLWAGFPFDTLQGDGVQILHETGQEELAGELLRAAEALYPRLAEALEIEQPTTLFIKLYTSDQEFRAGISLAFPQVRWPPLWTDGESSLKLWLEDDATADEYRRLLAVQMARHLLLQMGTDSEWLLKGASLYLAGTLDRGVGELISAGELYRLLRALPQGSPPTLEDMSPDYEISETELPAIRAQAWDAVRYLEYVHGRQGLLTVLRIQAQGLELDAALQAAIGQTLAEFEAAWVESLGRAHAPAAWIEVANNFDPERTDEHVAYLASPELAGRQAGSSGAEAAAVYIANRFADYGLEPIGENSGFFQTFPLTYTNLIAAPRLEIEGPGNQAVEPFAYRQDYLLVPGALGGQGRAVGELIWVRDGEYRDMDLAGKIVLRLPADALDVEAQRAAEHGASGLILIGPKEREREVWAKTLLPPDAATMDTIPVLQLTKGGYERLLKAIGQTHDALLNSPPAQPLGIEVRMEIAYSPLESGQTANVLGLLPGSDPNLAQEVIVLGAHYDHVGDDPPDAQGGGLRYPGANDDASGVAVLLEIARLWQTSGYRPARTVLFAAWAGQEFGELGSRYYVDHPLLPLTDTVAMLQLDAVGGGEGYYLEVQGGSADAGLLVFNMQVADELVDGRLTLRSEWAQSDQIPFHEAGIPSLLITWREASEDNWPVEIADEVDPYRLGVTGRMVTLAVMVTAR